MKHINEYINEEKATNSNGCVEMIQTILTELSQNHSDCKYDKEKNVWTGKDADLWKGAGQFLFDYLQELEQNDLKKIADNFGWKQYIPDINDIHPQDISVCVSLFLYNSKNNNN